MRVLFVDDEVSLQELMRAELPRLGHEVTVCPDGRTALIGDRSGVARFWDAGTGLPLEPEFPHPEAVLAVAFGAEAGPFLTLAKDKKVRAWRVADAVRGDPAEVVRRVRWRTGIGLGDDGRTFRPLTPEEWKEAAPPPTAPPTTAPATTTTT